MRAAAAVALGGLLLSGLACGRDAARQGPVARANYRRVQRAYDGAPPVVPHPVRSLNRQNCLDCHREGLDMGPDGLAPRAPHVERANCLQCHVEQVDPRARFVETSFVPLRHPAQGHRAFSGAPPVLPHPVDGREQCLGCHDRNGGSPLRTPHPDRVNCRQCHVEAQPGASLFRRSSFGGSR